MHEYIYVCVCIHLAMHTVCAYVCVCAHVYSLFMVDEKNIEYCQPYPLILY